MNTTIDYLYDDEEIENPDAEDTEEASGPGLLRISLWLVLTSLAALLIPVMLAAGTLDGNAMMLATQAADLQATVDFVPAEDENVIALQDETLTIRSAAVELENVQLDLESNQINWPVLMHTIAQFDAAQLELMSITQQGHTIDVMGRAISEATVMGYIGTLRQSDQFEDVNLLSVNRVTQVVTPTPFTTNFVVSLQLTRVEEDS